ncbi:MAG: S1/P1 Nuclease, partial [Bacteroidetes bacterium]|nr:S1/P1 Nuclease [Bacteroidota bacterium]
YENVKHNNKNVQDYSEAYAKAYHTMLRGMVERRMRSSILEIGSFWYSAWVDAGQPDLNKLIARPLTKDRRKKIKTEEVLYKQGRILTLDR